MAQGFELRVAAANALIGLAHLRQYLGPNIDPAEAAADNAAFERVEKYLDSTIGDPCFYEAETEEALKSVAAASQLAKLPKQPVEAGQTASESEKNCTFCGVAGTYAHTLVASPGPDPAHICDGCVKLASSVVEQHHAQHPLRRAAKAGEL